MRQLGRSLDEGTARFAFQGAVGVGSFATLASLGLGLRGNTLGAAIFLVLALISLGALVYFGRIYLRLRRRRWQNELERPNAALQQLFDRARAEQAVAPPSASKEAPAPDGEDTDRA
jgi:uncharacterized protein (DUF58 family)